MAAESSIKRNGFVTMVHNTRLANDGGALYKPVSQEVVELAKKRGWREYFPNQEPAGIKAFDPEAAAILKQQKEAKELAELNKLQERMMAVVQAGGVPVLADLKVMSDVQFSAALAELQSDETDGEEMAGGETPKGKPGRKPKEVLA